MDQFVLREIQRIQKIIMPSKQRISSHTIKDEYVIFADHSPVSWFFSCAVILMAQKIDSVRANIICLNPKVKIFLDAFLEETKIQVTFVPNKDDMPARRIRLFENENAYFDNLPKHIYKKICICTFLDASGENLSSRQAQVNYTAIFNRILDYAENTANAKLVHTETLPQIYALLSGMAGISEREYEIYAAQFPDNSQEKLVLKCEEMIREKAKVGVKAVVSRLQNVYGAGVPNVFVDELRKEILQERQITIDASYCNHYINFNHIVFTAAQIHYMFIKGHSGHIYNLGQFRDTFFNVSSQLLPYLTHYGVNVNFNGSIESTPCYQLLCCKKAEALLSSKYAKEKIIKSLYLSVIANTNLEYYDPYEIFTYDGKLDAIKAIELDMMSEIKQICEKHNIRYFLVGGSLLGAIRHKGFIPWDDDLDIGMLREDYDKFTKVAPQELSACYYYQQHINNDGSHYIFDKIRLKDTFFSTKFSDQFEIENGVFIDILVYDKTAKTKFNQKLHIWLITLWSRAINVRWVNKPRKKVYYRLTKILLPVMRRIPFNWFHNVFNKILTRYQKTNSGWLIDGVGQNVRKGAFPEIWFEEIVEVPFENMTLPIPAYYDEYLRHWYGNNYMQLLPIEERKSGHIMKRVDLGAYISRFGYIADVYHSSNIKGELLDEIKE